MSKKCSRREFLKGVASLAAVSALPAAVAYAADTTASAPSHIPWKDSNFHQLVLDLCNAVSEVQKQSMGCFNPMRDEFHILTPMKSYHLMNGTTTLNGQSVVDFCEASWPNVVVEPNKALHSRGLVSWISTDFCRAFSSVFNC